MLTLTDARELATQLGDALQTRDLIGQAKGVLIAQGAASAEDAFALLVAASQRSNIKVHDVARDLLLATIRSPAAATPSSG